MYQELIQFFARIGIKFFGRYIVSLRELTEKSNLPIIYETYIGQLFFYGFLSVNLFLVYFLYIFLIFWRLKFAQAMIASAILTATITFFIATVFYLYPFAKYQKQKEDLERNMAFGISYMNIISKSGVPLQKTIYYLSKEKDFGEFSNEFQRVHKYLTFMGKDMVSSLKEVSSRTSSERFKKFADGLAATIMSGSDINKYLAEESKKEIENYKERGAKYISVVSLFADVFIVLLLISPLCLITILAVFSMMDPSFFGLEIASVVSLIVYIALPAAGAVYLAALSRFSL